jgi:Flp pilus assembly protein TadG
LFNSNRSGKNHNKRGQSLVEVSISLIPILMIMSGLFDLGRMYFVYDAVADAAGEGALFLSVTPKCFSPDISGCDGPNNVQYRMQLAGGKLVDLRNSSVRIEYSNVIDCVYYAQVAPGGKMPTTLTLDVAKSPTDGSCVDASLYTYTTGTDQVSVQLIDGYELLTPMISRMVPLYNGKRALPLNTLAVQTIIVR